MLPSLGFASSNFVILFVLCDKRVNYHSSVYRLSALTYGGCPGRSFKSVCWESTSHLPGTWRLRMRSVLLLAGVVWFRGQRRVDAVVVETVFGFQDLLKGLY